MSKSQSAQPSASRTTYAGVTVARLGAGQRRGLMTSLRLACRCLGMGRRAHLGALGVSGSVTSLTAPWAVAGMVGLGLFLAAAPASAANCGTGNDGGANSTACGTNSTATGGFSSAYGNAATATGGDATAVGASANANGNNTSSGDLNSQNGNTAVGAFSNASNNNGTGISNNTSVGRRSFSQGNNSSNTSLGYQSFSFGNNAGNVAIGNGSSAFEDGGNNVAVGNGASAHGAGTPTTSAVALGFNAFAGSQIAVPTGFGNDSSVANSGGNAGATAIGTDSQAGSTANTQVNATALGANTRANAANALAVGQGANASLANAVALGQGSTTTAASSVANNGGLGVRNNAGAVAVGSGNVVSIGQASAARQVQNVAAGAVTATSTDAVNGSQLFSVATNVNAVGNGAATALGGGASYNATNGVFTAPTYTLNNGTVTVNNVGAALNNLDGRTTTNTNNITALQNGTAGPFVSNNDSTRASPMATSTDASAGGFGATAGFQGTALGNSSTAGSVSTAVGFGSRAQGAGTAVGNNSSATSGFDTALGSQSGATGGFSTAVGNFSQASATFGTALGNGTGASGFSSTALGSGSLATLDNSVALGANTRTTAASNTAGNGALGVRNNAGATQAGSGNVVSVGVAGIERQIQNVGAGAVNATSTDAVNGSQLFSVASNVNNVGTGAATAIGGGATYNVANGTFTGPSYQLNGSNQTFTTVVGGLQTLANGGAGPVQYIQPGTPSNRLQLVGTGGTVSLTNVAPGAVNAASTDAINGSQLFQVANAVANVPFVSNNANNRALPVAGGTDASAGGYGATASAAQSTALGNTSNASAANATALGFGAQASLANSVALGQGSTTTGASSIAGNTAIGVVNNAGAVAAGSGNVVSVGAAGATRQIQNVAAGAVTGTSTDAINGSQLFSVASNVVRDGTQTAAAIGGGATYTPTTGLTGPSYQLNGSNQTFTNVVSGQQALASGGAGPIQYSTPGTPSNALNLVGTGGPVTLGNVAPAVISATSTQAVNGSQLYGTSQSVANNFGGGSVVNANGTVSAPAYRVGNATYNNVGSAIDALQGNMQNGLVALQGQINRNYERLNGGVAAAIAGTGLRYDDRPGKISTAVAVAGWNGHAGVAAGIGGTSDDGLWRYNAAVTIAPAYYGNRTDFGGVVGLSHTWN